MQTHERLLAALDGYPRLPLAEYPTPLEPLPRLSRELGRPVYIKRDDEIGPGLGGNKTRKLEYLLADARQRGARKVVTFGGLQSNHARLTAAAACQLGLEPHLFYFARRPAAPDRQPACSTSCLAPGCTLFPLAAGATRA